MAGYHTMQGGYGEQQSTINWGKVGLVTGGGLAAYGVGRAIYTGGKKSWSKGALLDARQTSKSILGMGMPNGWKSYEQMGGGGGVFDSEAFQRAKVARFEGVEALGRQARGWKRPTGSSAKYKRAGANRRWHAAQPRASVGAERSTIDTRTPQQRVDAGLGKTPPAPKLSPQDRIDRMLGKPAPTPRGPAPKPTRVPKAISNVDPSAYRDASRSANPYLEQLRALRKTPLDKANFMKPPSGINSAWSGAKGYFGAMDWAERMGGPGGLKRLGVAGARVGLGLGAIGLGMKALSYLNPFGD